MTQVKVRDLSRQVSTSLNQSEESGARIIDAFIGALKGAVAAGRVVEFPGFGTFSLIQKDDAPWPTAVRAKGIVPIAAAAPVKNPRRVGTIFSPKLDQDFSSVLFL